MCTQSVQQPQLPPQSQSRSQPVIPALPSSLSRRRMLPSPPYPALDDPSLLSSFPRQPRRYPEPTSRTGSTAVPQISSQRPGLRNNEGSRTTEEDLSSSLPYSFFGPSPLRSNSLAQNSVVRGTVASVAGVRGLRGEQEQGSKRRNDDYPSPYPHQHPSSYHHPETNSSPKVGEGVHLGFVQKTRGQYRELEQYQEWGQYQDRLCHHEREQCRNRGRERYGGMVQYDPCDREEAIIGTRVPSIPSFPDLRRKGRAEVEEQNIRNRSNGDPDLEKRAGSAGQSNSESEPNSLTPHPHPHSHPRPHRHLPLSSQSNWRESYRDLEERVRIFERDDSSSLTPDQTLLDLSNSKSKSMSISNCTPAIHHVRSESNKDGPYPTSPTPHHDQHSQHPHRYQRASSPSSVKCKNDHTSSHNSEKAKRTQYTYRVEDHYHRDHSEASHPNRVADIFLPPSQPPPDTSRPPGRHVTTNPVSNASPFTWSAHSAHRSVSSPVSSTTLMKVAAKEKKTRFHRSSNPTLGPQCELGQRSRSPSSRHDPLPRVSHMDEDTSTTPAPASLSSSPSTAAKKALEELKCHSSETLLTDRDRTGAEIREEHYSLRRMEEDVTCPICMSIIVAAHAVSPCGHTLCGGCGFEWVRENPTCPICRKPLATPASSALIPLHSMDGLIERWVACSGPNWKGLQDYKDKKECWEAELAVIREDEALEAAMRHQVSTISSQAVMPPSPVTLDGGDEYRMRDDGFFGDVHSFFNPFQYSSTSRTLEGILRGNDVDGFQSTLTSHNQLDVSPTFGLNFSMPRGGFSGRSSTPTRMLAEVLSMMGSLSYDQGSRDIGRGD